MQHVVADLDTLRRRAFARAQSAHNDHNDPDIADSSSRPCNLLQLTLILCTTASDKLDLQKQISQTHLHHGMLLVLNAI